MPSADQNEPAFMCASVGVHKLVFDLRTLLSIEGTSRVQHEAILGPLDLREWLGEEVDESQAESLLVLGEGRVYRFVVDRIERLAHSALETIHPVPPVLGPLAKKLCLRGVVEIDNALAFLVDPRAIAVSAGLGQESP
jgi:chemotaxis signal transduction protein